MRIAACGPLLLLFPAIFFLLSCSGPAAPAPQASSGKAIPVITWQPALFFPNGITFDANGDLIVADTSDGRVLIFDPPFTTGMNASAVIGQTDMSSRQGHGCEGYVGLYGNPSASTLCDPQGVLAF